MIQTQQREDAILAAARPMPARQRASYLDETCGSDTSLRARLETRLASPPPGDTGTASTSVPPADDDQTIGTTLSTGGVLNRIPEEAPGDAIGRYTLIEVIGEGGCGLVYLAEQKEPVKRQVALKITKLGMDTKQVVIRFEAERQALALMDHPNIASVIDGGATATGRPFFVMELVRGVRITEYCDEHKLSTRKRLELFIQVCQAIDHAHEKGVVHRDIKPSNILVTEHDGVPACKVIDFGIAKATHGTLTDKTVYTQVDQFMGTPAYMSPEQAAMGGMEPDARSDIYSLGVLLYELLTGYTPFESKGLLARGFDEMRRLILEMEPLRPSNRLGKQAAEAKTNTASHHGTDAPKLINIIRGDLDWIVMKCLEKDRARRYASAAELTQEIQRFLANQPVTARPPGHLYRFEKLVLRNRLAFAAGGVFFATLVAGLCVTTWFVFKELEERELADRAEKSAEIARKTAEEARDRAEQETKSADEARLKAVAALQESETNRLKAEASEKAAMLSKQETEAAWKKTQDALQLAEQERKNAELANQKARASKTVAEAAESEATNAESKSAEAVRTAATEAALRRQAETARQEAEAATALARVESVQLRATVSNLLAGLDALPPAESLKAAAVFFQPGAESQPSALPFLRQRGEWRARLGDSTNALADFAKVLAQKPDDIKSFTAAAPLLAQTADAEAYRRACVQFLASYPRTNNAALNAQVAIDCLLAPFSATTLPEAVALARQALEAGADDPDHPRREWAMGLAEYRQSHFAEAAALAGKATSSPAELSPRNIPAYAILALAQEQLKQPDAARATLTKATQTYEASLPKPAAGDLGPDWRDVLIAKTLLQEAASLIQPPPAKPGTTTQ